MTATALHRKISAAFLLCALLLTTVVQVAHSHKSGWPATAAINKPACTAAHESIAVTGPDTRCFVCEYQLTQDADLPLFILNTVPDIAITAYPYLRPQQTPVACNNCFESRGPPCHISA